MAMMTFVPLMVKALPSGYDAIRERVESRRTALFPLYKRFDEDQDLDDLLAFNGEDGFEDLFERGYRTYTSNHPSVFSGRLMEFVEGAHLNFKIRLSRELEDKRIANQAYKDFLIAAFRMADKRRQALLEPVLQGNLGHDLTIRGWACGRALMRRDEMGRTFVDIQSWDPRDVVWQMGPRGLLWACRITYQTLAELKAQHPEMRNLTNDEWMSPDQMLVYDYYDEKTNAVFTEDEVVKVRTLHGSPEIPVYLGFVGGKSMAAARSDYTQRIEKVGESCFKDVRSIYPTLNFLISTWKHLVGKRMDRSYVYESYDGTGSVPDDPFDGDAQEIQIRIGEKIEQLEIAELGKEGAELLGIIQGDIQRGSIPHAAFGELAFQLSGYAIETLKESIAPKIEPIIRCAENLYWQIADKLRKQYETGAFQPIETAGAADQAIPMLIRHADDVTVKLTARYPQDMQAKIMVAQQARQPDGHGVPLVSHSYALEQLVGVEDVESMLDQIDEEQAERATPTSMALTYFNAAEDRGREDLAEDHAINYQMLQHERYLQMMMTQMRLQQLMMAGVGLAMPGGGGMGPEGGQAALPAGPPQEAGPGVNGVPPSAVPQQMLGAPQPAASPQSGPFVPPGQPRPGRQNGNQPAVV